MNIVANNNLNEKQEKALLAKIPAISMSVNREAELLAEIDRLTKMQAAEAAAKQAPAVVEPAPTPITPAPVETTATA